MPKQQATDSFRKGETFLFGKDQQPYMFAIIKTQCGSVPPHLRAPGLFDPVLFRSESIPTAHLSSACSTFDKYAINLAQHD